MDNKIQKYHCFLKFPLKIPALFPLNHQIGPFSYLADFQCVFCLLTLKKLPTRHIFGETEHILGMTEYLWAKEWYFCSGKGTR
jgi:hypothetical protein